MSEQEYWFARRRLDPSYGRRGVSPVSGQGWYVIIAFIGCMLGGGLLFGFFMAQGRTLMSMPSGWLAKQLDWPEFWALTALMAIPGLILLVWLMRLYPDEKKLTTETKEERTVPAA